MSRHLSRRCFVQSAAAAAAAVAAKGTWDDLAFASGLHPSNLLSQFGYGDVILASDLHESQLHRTHSVLMQLSDDSLLKPFRQMAGLPAPGEDISQRAWRVRGGGATYYRLVPFTEVGSEPYTTYLQAI